MADMSIENLDASARLNDRITQWVDRLARAYQAPELYNAMAPLVDEAAALENELARLRS